MEVNRKTEEEQRHELQRNCVRGDGGYGGDKEQVTAIS